MTFSPPTDTWTWLGIDHTTPLVEVPSPPADGFAAARIMIAHAIRCRYLSAGVPELFESFHDALGPGIPSYLLKRPFSIAKKEGISTCGLFLEHVHALCGVDAVCLYEPYYPIPGPLRYAVTRAIEYAKKMAAWQRVAGLPGLVNLRPSLGDYMVIGCRSSGEDFGGIEHALMPVSQVGEDTYEFVEAGQVDEDHGGLQCVKLQMHLFEERTGELWLTDLSPKPGRRGRKVLGWIPSALLSYRASAKAPEGWDAVSV
jgi:hypothetical protein